MKSWLASRWCSGSSSTGSAKACWAQTPIPLKIWGIRGVLLLVMAGAYVFARKQWHVEEQKV